MTVIVTNEKPVFIDLVVTYDDMSCNYHYDYQITVNVSNITTFTKWSQWTGNKPLTKVIVKEGKHPLYVKEEYEALRQRILDAVKAA